MPATTPVLERMAALSGHLYLDGAHVASSGPRTAVIDPATERPTGEWASATGAEVEAAVAAARRAQREWWAMSALERAAALHLVADRMLASTAVVGECLTREMGKPYRESNWEGGASAGAFRYYAELARHDQGRIAGPAIAGQLHMTMKEPLGTVVSIVPFNFPVLLFGWQAAGALAAGNAIIVKPSDLTPLTLLVLMDSFAHLPPGLVQVVTGGAEVGQALVAHEHTHGVAFTGSVGAARAVATTAAQRFKPALIEASGNDAFIVMPSADVETAARGAAFAAFLNCGQVCTSAERLYVHEAVHDRFVEALARAVAQGARVVCGGRRPPSRPVGWYYEPTVLEVRPGDDVMHGECFGPLAPVARVASLDEAIAHANDSELGLGANIYTSELSEAFRAVREIETGIVWVNTPLNDNDAVPFGGRKYTGSGRELGAEGLEQFRRSKMVMIAPDAAPDPEWFPYPDGDAYPG
jgi:betaine-aldehyde dehydrogenase